MPEPYKRLSRACQWHSHHWCDVAARCDCECHDALTRPRAGQLQRADGTMITLRFIPTADPNVFLAVTVDGERAVCRHGDRVAIDVIGPGQAITFDTDTAPIVIDAHADEPD